MTKKEKKSKKWIGAHVSISGGVQNALYEAKKIGADAMAIFPKNQRQWKAAPYTSEQVDLFHQRAIETHMPLNAILAHSSYLINLANADKEAQLKAYTAFVDEITRCYQLGISLLNIHPGAHLNKLSEKEALTLIADQINRAIEETADVTVVLETTAGQGSCLGHTFEQLAQVIEKIKDSSRIGVCIDTCHIYAAGYNIKDRQEFEKVFDSFDKIIGFPFLKGMHLNDSKARLGQRIDRHHSLGKGELGLDPFKWIMKDGRFGGIPLILETIDEALWPLEIELLRSFE